VSQLPADQIPGLRRTPFPRDADEALALTALEFAARGMTMVFVARKTSAEPFGRAVRDAIQLRRQIAEETGDTFDLPVSPAHMKEITRCAELAREHMGVDCDIATFLEEGFVVHHGSLPQAVRLELERLVRAGAVRLVIATTTLAQGVNFPIHTVLVRSLDHGKGEFVSPMDFWNICGRAGRGMRENEGQVLFFVCESFSEWASQASRKKWLKKLSPARQRAAWEKYCKNERDRRNQYISDYGTYQVGSMLRDLVSKIAGLWRERHESVDVPDLCEALANHTLELFAPSEQIDLENILSTLDGFLLAMAEGREDEEVTADTFQNILRRSLIHLQLPDDAHRSAINEIFTARIKYVRSKHGDSAKRRQFYRLGLPLRDCEKIDAARDELLALYLKASAYAEWSPKERSDHLAEAAGFLFNLSEIAPSHPLPECWQQILFLWLSGKTPNEIAADLEVAAEGVTATLVSRWIDDVCGYRLPWGYNVLALYVKDAAAAAGEAWPTVCDYYSSFAKFGVHQLVACWLLTFGVASRRVATRAADVINEAMTEPDDLLNWLRGGGLATLEKRGVSAADIAVIREAVTGMSQHVGTAAWPADAVSAKLRTSASVADYVVAGDRVLLRRVSDQQIDGYRVHTLRGDKIGEYLFSERTGKLWEPLAAPELLDSVVESVEPLGTDIRLTIRITSI
jgi:hypothetical protein